MPGANSTEPAAAQSPTAEKWDQLLDGLRRIKTHSPVMLLPRLIMSQHLATSLARSRGRLADSHKHLHRLMGETVEPDDEGDITLQGDTTTTINNHGLTTGGLVRAAILAALLGGGGKLAYDWYTAPPSAASPAERPGAVQDWKLGVVVEKGL